MKYLSAVDYCFPDVPGGMGRVAWDVAVLMQQRGHEVAVFCMAPKGRDPGSLPGECAGIRIVRYRQPEMPKWHPRRAARTMAAAADVAESELRSTQWDVVHMHTPFTGWGAVNGLGPGPRYMYTMHSPMVLEQKINWAEQGAVGRLKLALGLPSVRRIEGGLLRQCAAIQTLSQYTRTELQSFHGLGDRATVIPHWRRPELRRTHTKREARKLLEWPETEPILFTLRRHGSRYGIDIAIRAVAPLAAGNRCTFMIGGDGAMRPVFEQLVRDLGVSHRIQFLGRISDEKVALAYEAADLFVLPTRALECFGLIIQEAFAYGCPVLSSDAGAIPETMNPIMPDFVVPAGNVGALRAKIEEFLDGRLVAPPPATLLSYVEERFSSEAIVPRLMNWIEGRA